MKLLLTIIIFCITSFHLALKGQSYEIDAQQLPMKQISIIDMQSTNPNGESLSVNNQYFEKNGKPWYPLMGEIHYNRVPEKYWEEAILQMKSAGLSIIATYVFWNEHETQKGIWDWKGNRDLNIFLKLCKKHGMYVWLRIGPYAHGEQLYGGFPKWIEDMKTRRTNDPDYLGEVTKYFNQIGFQSKGMFFKEGGPIIGIQLENEYASGQLGHILALKKLAIAANIQPVYWSVTANTVFDDKKMPVIPLQGAYPYRGWEKAGGGPTRDFLYGDDNWILTGSLGKVFYDINKFPKGFCELGAGSQITFKNRFIVQPAVIEALLQNEIGRGINMVGYYMFHGGTQTPGLREPGLPESYDFQAPITEFGLIRKSYKYLKLLHHFLNDFGSDLAAMQVVEPKDPVRDPLNTTDLRYVARVHNNSGFLFLTNTQVRVPMPDKQISVKVRLAGETITFPSMLLKGQCSAILPFNLRIKDALLKYATAQPLARFKKGKAQYLFLTKVPGMQVQLAFDKKTIKALNADHWHQYATGNTIILTPQNEDDLSPINIVSSTGEEGSIILLTRKQAENSWRTEINGQQSLILSNTSLTFYGNKIESRRLNNPDLSFMIFPHLTSSVFCQKEKVAAGQKGIYQQFYFQLKKLDTNLKVERTSKNTMKVSVPDHLAPTLGDMLLKIHYYGGSATASINKKVVTDNLFNGIPWIFGLKRFIQANSVKEIKFQVSPWSDDITGIADSVVQQNKQKGPALDSIQVIEQ